jgi:hypothetical protein
MRSNCFRLVVPLVLLCGWPALAQANTGELRLRVQDPASHGLKASVTLSSEADGYRRSFTTDDAGDVDIKTLAYGMYVVHADKPGFAETSRTVEIRSALAVDHTLRLVVSTVRSVVQVNAAESLIDPHRPSSEWRRLKIARVRCRGGRCRT